MNTIKYMLLLVGFAALLGGCDPFVEDYEVSPNEPEEVSPEALLAAAEAYTFNNYHGNAARIVSVLTEQQGPLFGPYMNYGQYFLNGSDIDNTWSVSLYAGALKDCRELIRLGEEQNKPWYAATGRILTAMNLGMATSCWGDVPYTEALTGKDNLTPAFDSQESVYQNIQAMLDQAILELEPYVLGDSIIPFEEEDLLIRFDYIYGQDINNWVFNWTGTAWALKARYHNHLSQVDPAGSAENALAAIDGFNSILPYRDAMARFGASATQSNFWSQFDRQAGMLAPGAFLVDTMNALFDPRLPLYATPNDSFEFVGVPPGGGGAPQGLQSYLGDLYWEPDASLPLITQAEVRFIEAECLLRLGDPANATFAYADALTLALDGAGVSIPEADAYIAQQTPEEVTLADVMLQKYLAQYLQIETWTDYRRTGLPQIYLTPGAEDFFPLSLPTAQAEAQRNPNATNNPDGALPVWWDVD